MTDQSRIHRTKTGRVLTDADIAALAEEAQRGYDVRRLSPPRGRPRMGAAPAVVVPVRLHADLYSAVKLAAADEGTSLSELVRDSLHRYLSGPVTPRDLRTKSGHIVAATESHALVAAAEAGYDIGALRGRRARSGRAEVMPVRMPPEL